MPDSTGPTTGSLVSRVREAICRAVTRTQGASLRPEAAHAATTAAVSALCAGLLVGEWPDWDAIAGPAPRPGFYWAAFGAEKPEVVEVGTGGFVFSVGREGENERRVFRILSPRLPEPVPPDFTAADAGEGSENPLPTGPSVPRT